MAAFVALAWVFGFAWFVGAAPGSVPGDTHTDAIVVLTGDDGRTARGLKLLRAHAAPRLLISGVGPTTTSAEIAADNDAPSRLVRCCVDLGHSAVDTRSNAEETAAWARAHHVGSLRLVTSNYHMRRARLELAAELGPGVTILPDAVPSNIGLSPWVREYGKWLWRSAVRGGERA